MGVTEQTLKHLKLLRAGGVLQRYQDQVLIRHDNLQIPLQDPEFKRLYAPGLVERVSFDTLEEYQLTPAGHRAIAENDTEPDPTPLIAGMPGASLVTTAKVTDDTGNDIPYFLIADLGDLTPHRLLDLHDRMRQVFTDTPQAETLQLSLAGAAIAPLTANLPSPFLYATRDEIPAPDPQELQGGAIYITPDHLDLVGMLLDGRFAMTSLTPDQLRQAITNTNR